MPQTTHSLLQACLNSIGQGTRVLDLGSGDGRIARRFAERGAKVTAVDKLATPQQLAGVNVVVSEVVDFVERLPAAEQYDVIFLRNIIQFIDFTTVVEQLLPKLQTHVQSGGHIAIGTFYRDPDPPFEHTIRSMYTLNDLRHVFPGWREVVADERKEVMNDLRGQERLFFVTELMMQRP